MIDRRPLLALALVLAGCRCGSPGISNMGGSLRISPQALEFGEVWRGSTKTLALEVVNDDRAPVDVALELEPPFSVPNPPTRLAGGEALTLEVLFRPEAEGDFVRSLSLRHGAAKTEIPVHGKAIAPPPCEPSLCRSARLDPASGLCVQTALPDDTSCASSCLVEGRCQAGNCVGTPKSCDDSDACTVDLCDAIEGCRHTPTVCAPSGPCSSPTCDSRMGCVDAPVVDGTPCGAADCSVANVCIGGTCVTRQVPEGAPCGSESLCQARGRCVNGQCDQPDASVLPTEWRYEPTVAGSGLVGLVADARGDLFTVECGPGAGLFMARCSLVSFSPTGQERWRTPFPRSVNVGLGALQDSLTVAGELVISWVERSFVSAFDVSTGAHRWTVNLAQPGFFGRSVEYVWIRSLAFDGVDRLSLALEAFSSGVSSASSFVELDSVSGGTRRVQVLPFQGFSLVEDRRGTIYLANSLPPVGGSLREAVSAFDPQGQLRWQRVVPIGNLRIRNLTATHQDLLSVTRQTQLELIETTTGALAGQTQLIGDAFGFPIWSDRRFFTFMQVCMTPPCQSFTQFDYRLLSLDARSLTSSSALLPRISEVSSLWLTNRQSAIFTLWPQAPGVNLYEFDADANLVMKCPLELERLRLLGGGPVLTEGRYAMLTRRDGSSVAQRLDVWVLPGYRPAASGWISRGGGPGHDGRAH